MKRVKVRHQKAWEPVAKEELRSRFFERFYDPAFDALRPELETVFEKVWASYKEGVKSPRTRKAGRGFHEPGHELSVEWLAARAQILAAQRRQKSAKSPSRILIINGSPRSEHTCPGEISKTLRLAQHAQRVIGRLKGYEVDFLDLSDLVDEPMKVIYPCKACVSTAMPLCHWPCSCYPNHYLNQTNDWMAEIYPRWVAAHGVFILCPVHWYQAPSALKLMIDRLVCADGGNPDPTTTHGKDTTMAKTLELKGWNYPKHLAGRAFAVVAHGDAAGPENLRRMLCDWLTDMGLIQAGPLAARDPFIGYYAPYATSHDELDADEEVFADVRNAALSLARMVEQIRSGEYESAAEGLHPPIEK